MLDREDQRRLAPAVDMVDARAAPQQQLRAFGPADLGGERERRIAVIVRRSGLAPLPSRKPSQVRSRPRTRMMERAVAGVALAAVDDHRARAGERGR